MDARGVRESEDVLSFWFEEHEKKAWFVKDPDFDAAILNRFGALHASLCADPDLAMGWAMTARGALALLIVLDQFSRNMFRGEAKAFAADSLAREIARISIAKGFQIDASLPEGAGLFFLLPFEHSEALADQDWACALCEVLGDADTLAYAEQHRAIIRRFGRFPHRNAALDRPSTPEEDAFLQQPGSSF